MLSILTETVNKIYHYFNMFHLPCMHQIQNTRI